MKNVIFLVYKKYNKILVNIFVIIETKNLLIYIYVFVKIWRLILMNMIAIL